ncbi:MAG: hypothetical protein FJ011_26265 [Chloroflexi bacterium]|nr:hypothetical protein [Chloroflexota bacterium]
MQEQPSPIYGAPIIRPRPRSPFGREQPVGRSSPADIERDPPTILVPRPGDYWWYGGWFAPALATEQLHLSLGATRTYRDLYAKRVGDFRWRLSRSPATLLPSYVRGWLESSPGHKDGQAIELANWWLDQEWVMPMLAGRRDRYNHLPDAPSVVTTRWRLPGGQPPATSERTVIAADEAALRFHVRYQQWLGEWPVFGGQVVVHQWQDRKHLACTSSFFPISRTPDAYAPPYLAEDEVLRIARSAVAHYLADDQAAAISEAEVQKWPAWVERFIGETRKSDKVVLPFAGDYRLAHEARVQPSVWTPTWRVFVDAQTGAVLGRPHLLGSHQAAPVPVFRDSDDAADHLPAQTVAMENRNPCDAYMDVAIQTAAGVRCQPAWQTNAAAGLDFEARNIAHHSARFLEYLQQVCGAPAGAFSRPAGNPRRLQAELHEAGPASLATFFDAGQGRLIFQHDAGAGLTTEGGLVRHPAHDPELIYHELAHAFMWLVADTLFTAQANTPPVGRAILEGYATYLARSCGGLVQERAGAPVSAHWARAAYPPTDPLTGAPDWDSRWALFRGSTVPGADVLLAPELYPFAETTFNLDDYDAGMVWARALWDLRQLAGAALADNVAFDAFTYPQGGLATFGPIVDGLLTNADAQQIAGEIAWGGVLPIVLAGRRLLGGGDVRGLAVAGSDVVAAGRLGVWRSADDGQTWGDWSQMLDGGRLGGVVALAVTPAGINPPIFYAIALSTTGAGAGLSPEIYWRSPADGGWQPVGGWPINLRPFSLAAAANGDLYVGTGQGVRRGQAAAGGRPGAPWDPHDPLGVFATKFSGLALDMACGPADAQGRQALCVAGFNGLWRMDAAGGGWTLATLQDEARDLVTSVLARGSDLFIGSGRAGVWRGVFGADGNLQAGSVQPIIAAAALEGAAVLSLAAAGKDLYASTSAGVFRCQSGPADWQAAKLPGLPLGADVTALAGTADGALLAGTASHGLWRREAATWRQVDIAASAIAPLVPGADPALPALPASAAVAFAAFYLTQARQATIAAPPAAGLRTELWWIGPNVRLIAATNAAAVQQLLNDPGFYAVAVRRSV